MNPFEPARLSPIPRALVPCPLPYELTWAVLPSILPGFDQRRISSAQAFSSHEKQGLNGGSNSCILTLRYPTGETQFRAETVFIKHTLEIENREAQKYRSLASLGIPTPHVLGVIHRDNAEIILLEFLPKIGIDFHSQSEVTNLLHLVAQLNAIQDPPEVFDPSPGIPQAEFDERVRLALTQISQARSSPVTVNVPRWFELYQTAYAASQSMPLAVNHNELSFQQVGWAQRTGSSQLVIFDLETMSLRPRFTDIAGLLPRLAEYTGQDQFELFQIYLNRFRELCRLELNDAEAFQELRLVRITETFWSLPWLVEVAGNTELNKQLDDPLTNALNGLQVDLTALGFL